MYPYRLGLTLAMVLSASASPALADTGSDDNLSKVVLTSDVFIPKPAQIRLGLIVAAQYWGRTPDCPNGITWKRLEALDEQAADPLHLSITFSEPATPMAAETPGCTIWAFRPFLAGRATARRCTAIVHEVGHLMGRLHDLPTSEDPEGVMAPTVVHALSACKAGR